MDLLAKDGEIKLCKNVGPRHWESTTGHIFFKNWRIYNISSQLSKIYDDLFVTKYYVC